MPIALPFKIMKTKTNRDPDRCFSAGSLSGLRTLFSRKKYPPCPVVGVEGPQRGKALFQEYR